MNQLLFEQFVIADSAKTLCGTTFNEFKKDLLKNDAQPAGYETVVVRQFCKKCGGKGERFVKKLGTKGRYVPCTACHTTGYYKNEKRYYNRFVLHGMIFTLRTFEKPHGEPVEIKQGYKQTDPVDPKTAYRAMLILFARYNESLLNRLLSIAYPAQDIWAKEKEQILKLIEELKAA